MKLSNKTYDVLKYIAQIVLPACGTAYAGLAAIWGLPASNKVVATVVVFDTFLGILLNISTTEYLSGLTGSLTETTYQTTSTTETSEPYYTAGYIAPVQQPGDAAAQETSDTTTT